MNLLQSALLIVSPYLVLLCGLLWPNPVGRFRRQLSCLARYLPALAALALFAGEIWNGFWEAEGFHAGLFALGLFGVGVANVIALYRPWRDRLLFWLYASLRAFREDFFTPQQKGSRSTYSVAGFLVASIVFYVLYTTYGAFNYHLKYFALDFIDLLKKTGERTSFFDVLTGDECTSTRLYRLFPMLIFAISEYLTYDLYYHIWIAVILGIFAIQWAFRRREHALVLLASHIFYTALSVNQAYEYNQTGYFELGFALLYLIGLLLVLHARLSPISALFTGVSLGLAFAQKELALFLVAMYAFRLAASELALQEKAKVVLFAALGFSAPSAFIFNLLARCGATEGVYHVPIFWYRGILLQTELTQTDVKIGIDTQQVFPLWELILRRLSFQTIGELIYGGLHSFGFFCFVGVFPIPYMVANLKHVSALYAYLFLGFFFYGLTYWKGGDSSDPLYTMLPFGYVYSVPYLICLTKLTVASVRKRLILKIRGIYPIALLALNVVFLAQQVPGLATTLKDLRHLSGLSRKGLVYDVVPTGSEAELLRVIQSAVSAGDLRDRLFVDCSATHVPRPLIRYQELLTPLSLRFNVLQILRNQDIPRLRHAFRVMTYDLWYNITAYKKVFVLTCFSGPSPESPEPLYSPGHWLGGCVEVLFAAPKNIRTILIAFDIERCKRYLPHDLLKRERRLRPELPFIK